MNSHIDAYRLTSGGAPARMAILRKRLPSGDWKSARNYRLNTYASAFALLSPGKQSDGSPIWYSHGGPEFRGERDAHDIVNLRHKGWFTDTECSETAVGIVARLPHGRFLAGYRWTSNGERVYFPEVFTDEDEAARAADSYAEAFAEDAREDSERFNAMQEAADEITHVEALLRKRLPGRNATDTLRDEVRSLIEELRAARRDLETATEAYERGTL